MRHEMNEKQHKGIILVGDGEELTECLSRLKQRDDVVGLFCDGQEAMPAGVVRLGGVYDVPSYLAAHHEVGLVCCSTSRIRKEDVASILGACKTRAVAFRAVLPVVSDVEADWKIARQDGGLVLAPRREPLSYVHNRLLKRCMDLLLTVVFLLTFFPFVYLYKAFVLKRKKSGPSFSFRPCCGPDGRRFTEVSFRDEERSLARLFNVLTGRMSLVGPAAHGADDAGMHLERRHLKSGLTGWAQVHGCQGEDSLTLDVWYVEHWSLWLDVKIVCKAMF